MSDAQPTETQPDQAGPVVNVARLGSLTIYEISEDELEKLEQASPASILLNFAIALLSIAVTLTASLLLSEVSSDRVYYTFVILIALGFLSGLVLMVLWTAQFRSSRAVGQTIRKRASRSGSTATGAEPRQQEEVKS